jgi:hypothetical protein
MPHAPGTAAPCAATTPTRSARGHWVRIDPPGGPIGTHDRIGTQNAGSLVAPGSLAAEDRARPN